MLFSGQIGSYPTCASFCEGKQGRLPVVLDLAANNRLVWQMKYHDVGSTWLGENSGLNLSEFLLKCVSLMISARSDR